MNFKFLMFGTTSIISVIITLSLLGGFQDLLIGLANNITGVNVDSKINQASIVCTRNSDCKLSNDDCSKCVNLLVGGFTLLSKCDDSGFYCSCVNNKCVANHE